MAAKPIPLINGIKRKRLSRLARSREIKAIKVNEQIHFLHRLQFDISACVILALVVCRNLF
jgi:hypothetical protein